MKYEIREDNSVELSGYINVVQRDSKKLRDKAGEFIEQIMPNAFKKSLYKTPNIPILFNHKFDRELGRNGVGECEIYEDNIGLKYRIRTNDDEVVELAKAGRLTGNSFGFRSLKETYETLANGIRRRFVHELELIECSILSVEPAYIATSVEVRAEGEIDMEFRVFDEVEEETIVEENVEETEFVEDTEVSTEKEPEVEEESLEDESLKKEKEDMEKLRTYIFIQKHK
ncbi:HK97 family phage prohead protease [uncultured Clostridium sp.]|uniref:HK97 family phage prohead protease n=1 Tax=uncultured Clostridium sp. TaxID=59620 RepID=UPI0025DF28A4|nr:HK97 family phage prohead protease [uncultured Clostridium sp.]